MRVRNLRMVDFRGFEDATIDLDRPLTVLVGVNGSGKSSVLEALAMVFSRLFGLDTEVQDYFIVPTDREIRIGALGLVISAGLTNGSVKKTVLVKRDRGVERDYPLPDGDLLRSSGSAPVVAVFYDASRAVTGGEDPFAPLSHEEASVRDAYPSWIVDAFGSSHIRFRSLFTWFREREDIENELKVSRADLSIEDRQLRAVRRAVEGMLPGFSKLRIQRDPLHMVVEKAGVLLAVDQLSDGEKLLLTLSADLGRRLALAFPKNENPLLGNGVVLIDEVELHLHPGWQRRALTALRETFPNCQFIVTTHSPQVLSEVPNDAVVLVDDFRFVKPGAPTAGRDSNAILEEVMGVSERPAAQRDALAEISRLIDAERYDDARARLDALARELTEHDGEVVRLRAMLHFLGGNGAADSQGH